jgi:hypothetical protein
MLASTFSSCFDLIDIEQMGSQIAASVLGITLEANIRWRVALAHAPSDSDAHIVIGIIS